MTRVDGVLLRNRLKNTLLTVSRGRAIVLMVLRPGVGIWAPDIYPQIINTLFFIAPPFQLTHKKCEKVFKVNKCSSTSEWVNCRSHEYYSMQKECISMIPVTRMNLKCITLCEGSPTQKAISCMIPYTWHSGKNKTIGTNNRSVVAKGWGTDLTVKGHEGIWGQ